MKKISTTLVILTALQLAGCTAPQSVNLVPQSVTFAPLATVSIDAHDNANGSANGNTITPVAP